MERIPADYNGVRQRRDPYSVSESSIGNESLAAGPQPHTNVGENGIHVVPAP